MPPCRHTPSPNFDNRGAASIDILLFHYTGMATAEEALARLCDPAAKVSAHYFIGLDGTVHQLVDEDKRAWHAGESYWAGVRDINSRSVGVEIVNPGHNWGYTEFPRDQIESVLKISLEIIKRHNIPATRVLAHSDVAPTRRQDPGERFPWAYLAAAGIGWFGAMGEKTTPEMTIGHYLSRIGYDVTYIQEAVTAFQRHYCPHLIGTEEEGRAGLTTLRIARALSLEVSPS